MTETSIPDPAKEFEAMRTIHATLAGLPLEAQGRVLAYIASVLNITDRVALPSSKAQHRANKAQSAGDGNESHDLSTVDASSEFATFADFCNAANPSNGVERVLVAGYWLQVLGQEEGFGSQDANRELKNLGHQSTNITRDLDHLQSGSPKLVIQVKKSGNTRQARKLYKLTHAGISRVKEMLGG
jgi:hypothetical protein